MKPSSVGVLPTAPLWPWVAAFVLHRAAVIALGFDGVYFWEETYRLLVAEALRNGWDVPLHELQADPYSGGSLVFAGLMALLSPLAGFSLLALKSVALAWSAAGLALWLAVADRLGGRAAAHALGLAWLAAPPVFVVFNVVAMGFHSDTVTLTGLQLLLMLRSVNDRGRRVGPLMAWMAAAGFAVWFSYTSAIPFAVAVAWALAAGALPPGRWPAAALGFAAGFSPWIVHQLTTGGTLDVVRQTFAGSSGTLVDRLARLYDLTVRGVPAALYFRDFVPMRGASVSRGVLAYPYLAIYVAAWATLARRLATQLSAARGTPGRLRRAVADNGREVIPLATFPLFLLVLACSNQEFNDLGAVPFFTFRTLAPSLPFVFLAIAGAASRWPAAARAGAAGALIVLAGAGSAQLLADGNVGLARREAEARQTGAEAMGHLIVFRNGTNPVFASLVDAMPVELRARAYRGIGFSFAYLYGTRRAGAPAAHLTTALLSVAPPHHNDALEGARLAIGAGLEQVAPLPPSPRRDELAAAIALAASGPHREAPRDLAALRSNVPSDRSAPAASGAP